MDFEWLGDPIPVDMADKQITTKPKTFYKYSSCYLYILLSFKTWPIIQSDSRTCKYLGTEYNVGDHVLIANSEADDPESIRHCYVASLVYMYEMSKLFIFIMLFQWSY